MERNAFYQLVMSRSSELIHKIDLVSFFNLGRKKRRADKHFARFNRRMMAGTIDSLLLLFLTPALNWIAPINEKALESIQADPHDPNVGRHIMLQILNNHEFMTSWFLNLGVQMVAFCIFSGICWHYWSATPGKMALRLKVVDAASEQPVSDRQIIIRLLGYWVSAFAFLLGFFWIGIDKKHRAWHDLMAGTTVITLPWKKKKEVETP